MSRSTVPTPRWDYFKYHGLGNDYLVLDPARFTAPPTAQAAALICQRQRGVGADGLLVGPLPAEEPAGAAALLGGQPGGRAAGSAPGPQRDGAQPSGAERGFSLRIYNPDGSEAEKSGNGLRIFARHLWEQGLVTARDFLLLPPGGPVRAHVLDRTGARIALEMGAVRFDSASIPMTGPPRLVLQEPLAVAGRTLSICAANVGNPHCVVLDTQPTPALARELGPLIERHAAFPQRTNVQFLQVLERHAIRIEIWERGAGYTEASGTSSCAAAAVACRLGLCASPVTVHMPGGELVVSLDARDQARLEGPVAAVDCGTLANEFLALLGLRRR